MTAAETTLLASELSLGGINAPVVPVRRGDRNDEAEETPFAASGDECNRNPCDNSAARHEENDDDVCDALAKSPMLAHEGGNQFSARVCGSHMLILMLERQDSASVT